MVECVLEAVKQSVTHINRKSHRTQMYATYVVLVPQGDPLAAHLSGNLVIEGPEDDVLKRYEIAAKKFFPDYICRITGDCPLMKPTIITKHVTEAVMHQLDYISNSIDGVRTEPDGWDVEVISKRAFKWLCDTADNPFDREHVTTLIKREPPSWAQLAAVVGHVDLSHVKVSVDTIEDLIRVKNNRREVNKKLDEARERGYAVFRF